MPSTPAFSRQPTELEIREAHVFEEPLIPIGRATTAEENATLAQVINTYVQTQGGEDVSAFELFLADHPDTPWRGALLTDLGIVYRRTGYFSKALTAWESAWAASKSATERVPAAIADRAVAELAELNARLGRIDRLESLFAEVADRDMHGAAAEKLYQAREGLAKMTYEPEQAFRCGPMALDRILAYRDPAYRTEPKILAAESSQRGTSLAQVQALSEAVGLRFQMAFRNRQAVPLVPAVVHWKAGHFAALVAEQGGRYLIEDPTFGHELWVSRTALDEENSGYALIPSGSMPAGWRSVDADEGSTIWGKGFTASNGGQYQTKCDPTSGGGGGGCSEGTSCEAAGLAQYRIHSMLVALNVTDEPVGYAPPFGPRVAFQVSYHQREVFQPGVPAFGNLGPKWTYDWLSFLEENPADDNAPVNVYLRGGGQETYSGLNPSNQSLPHPRSRAVVVRIPGPSRRYERRLADGSIEAFSLSDNAPVVPRKFYLTSWSDPQGNTVTLSYVGLKLTAVTDAIGQTTTFAYELPVDPLKITKVTDPFGRFATLEYNPQGQLWKITDVIGMTSQFTYGPGDFIDSLTTPYGTTQFTTGLDPGQDQIRWVEAKDPLGAVERVEFRHRALGISDTDPPSTVPSAPGLAPYNAYLHARNTYFWDKRASSLDPHHVDHKKAVITHWLHDVDQNVASGIKESEKKPLENRVWYSYPEQAWSAQVGGFTAGPATVARVLDDGSTQAYRYEYNSLGKVTRQTDPLGRATTFTYDTNGIDLLEVRQVNGQSTDLLASYTYNSQHLPLTHTDAGGQTTTFTYNAQGQIATVTTPPRAGITENRTTTYTYDSNGYLQSIAGPVAGSTRGYTYDGYGRVRTTTNSDGYTVTYDYDALDRQTKATYPDGTYDETVYNRLDLEKRRDRLGRWSETFYDALRRPVATRDPLGRTTTQQWCTCGSLDKTIDSNGNATTWGRDLQGRMTSETRADSAQWNYVYENTTSRLRQVTDPKSEMATFDYFLDNHAKQITYTNATTPTPTVSFTFDPIYDRIASVTDGTGTTTYAYYPVTSPSSIGALRLASLDGPLTSDTVVYTYDELGRLASRGVTGYVTSYSYDALGRRTIVATPVGSYSYAFDGVTSRPLTVTYPNGQSANYTYFGNSGNRLAQEIKHLAPGGAILSKNNYTYDAAFEIKTWTQQVGTNAANVYELSYDNADQLTAATLKTTDPTPTVLKRYAYNYDKAGNRDAEQVDDSVLSGTYNSRNQLTSRQPGGALLFRGTVNEPATVTVGGKPATVDASNKFQGTATVPSGTSNVVVTATDPSGNLRTNTYQVGASGTTSSYTYDANGNLTAAGSRTFEWDARNQLAAVVLGTRRTEYTYDWASRRVRVLEKDGATVLSDRRYVWGDSLLLEERDGVSGSVLKRFYESVTDEAGTRYFETRDHQGNVRDVTDGSGGLVARYDYDPYGRLTQTSGTRPAVFSYTGQWLEQGTSGAPQAGLYYYRARYYDPETARFLSEDPARSRSSPTLYAYVGNNPTNRVDPTGLQAVKCNCPDDKKPQVQNAFQQVCKLMLVNSGCAMALVKYGLTPCYARLCTTPPAITCTPDPSPPCAWTSPFNTGSGPIFLNTGAFGNKPCGSPNLTGLIAHEMYHVCAGGCDVVGPACTEAQANFTNARTSAIENACSGL